MPRPAGVLFSVLLAACSSKSEVKTADPHPAVAGAPTFTLFALAEVRGQIGPCGCNSDPLGDISRTAKVIADARAAGPVVVLDAGSTLYAKSPIPPALAVEEQAKADLLVAAYQQPLQVAAVGLGPADLAKPPFEQSVKPPRQAVNASGGGVPIEPPKIIAAGGAKLGVFGVIAKDAVTGVQIGDPVAAAKQAAADLKKQGAQAIVALVQASSKRDASDLVKQLNGAGIDLAIAGLGALAPEPEQAEVPEKLGDTWLVVPVNRGQVLPKLAITIRPGGAHGWSDAIGPAAAAARTAKLGEQLAAMDADLAKFAADPNADKAFVARKQQERAKLAAEKDALAASPYAIPADGSYFMFENVKINKKLACDQAVQSLVTQFYKTTGEANVKAGASVPVAQPAAGAPHYVGKDACEDCHADEVEFWKKTVHATAWQTLVDRGQQFDAECIGCHVTGYEKPGGTNMGHTDKLVDVQCETCHGPASIHVAKGGLEGDKKTGKPFAVALAPPDDLCRSQCHTTEHSDTFQREAYLRDILGKGHGEEARKKLGDGPTGHALRSAALDKAGRTLGAGCLR